VVLRSGTPDILTRRPFPAERRAPENLSPNASLGTLATDPGNKSLTHESAIGYAHSPMLVVHYHVHHHVHPRLRPAELRVI
jgi:hypothetical protein